MLLADKTRPACARVAHLARCAVTALLLFGLGAPATALAQAVTKSRMQSLDEQVQEAQCDVLGIASELDQLEEKLLYPSNTQLAVFVSMEKADGFRLDSVSIQVDGEFVARHVYSFKELEALKKGGVQRIYNGNARTGEHRLDVSIAGKLSGKDFTASQSFGFSKEVGPKLVGVTVGGDSAEPAILVKGW